MMATLDTWYHQGPYFLFSSFFRHLIFEVIMKEKGSDRKEMLRKQTSSVVLISDDEIRRDKELALPAACVYTRCSTYFPLPRTSSFNSFKRKSYIYSDTDTYPFSTSMPNVQGDRRFEPYCTNITWCRCEEQIIRIKIADKRSPFPLHLNLSI